MTRQHSVVTDMLPEHPDVVKEMKKMICCPHHPEMTVTARCIGHDVYLCPVCFTDTHRRCEIVKLSERKTDEQEAKDVRRSLDDIASMACSIKTKVENNKKSIAADKERVKKEISVQVRHITDTVKTLEIKAQQDVDNVLEQTLFGMDEVINETENIEKEIVRNRSLLDAAIQFGTDNDDKCLADLLMSKMAPLRERATTLYEKPHLKLEFKTNTPFTDMPSLGNVNAFEKEEKLNPPNGSQIDLSSDVLEDEQRSATPEDSYDGYDDDLSCISFDNDLEEQGSTTPEDSYDDDLHSISSDERDPEARHDIREDNDKKPCTILKILVLNDGRLVLLDFDNSKLKVLKADYSVQQSIRVNKNPLDMCQIAPNIIAVTFLETKRINKYKIEKGNILYVGGFTTELFCLGIAVYKKNVLAMFVSEHDYFAQARNSNTDSPKIEIRQVRNGRIIDTYSSFISISAKEHSLILRNPRRIVFTGENEFVLLQARRVIRFTLIPSKSKAKEKWFYACSSDGRYGDMREVVYDGGMLYICADEGGVLRMNSVNGRSPTTIIYVASARSFAIDRKRKRMIVGCRKDDTLHVRDITCD